RKRCCVYHHPPRPRSRTRSSSGNAHQAPLRPPPPDAAGGTGAGGSGMRGDGLAGGGLATGRLPPGPVEEAPAAGALLAVAAAVGEGLDGVAAGVDDEAGAAPVAAKGALGEAGVEAGEAEPADVDAGDGVGVAADDADFSPITL